MRNKIISQEKSNEELTELSCKIIDMLADCNIAEKYKIITSLKQSFEDLAKKENYLIGEFYK